MSTLNQAFIKAYQRRGVGAPHIPMPAASPAAVVAAPNLAPLPAPAEMVPANDDQTVVAAPSLVVKQAGAVARIDVGQRAEGRASSAVVSGSTVSERSGHHLGSAPAAVDEKAPMGEALRPVFEVERFEWPAIVTSLLDQSRLELTALVEELLPSDRGTLLVSGCRRGEGRTSVALLLARHLANSGARVALVDADFSRPQVAASLGTAAEVGWEETLSEASSSEALIESLDDRLVIVPLRRPVAESVLVASRVGLRAAIERIQAEFDVVCIDAGPLAESAAVCRPIWFGETPVDAVVVVRDVRHSRLEQCHAVGRQVVQLGARRWAIIENFV
jgi:Mrp family chromosome partitioning ATPase